MKLESEISVDPTSAAKHGEQEREEHNQRLRRDYLLEAFPSTVQAVERIFQGKSVGNFDHADLVEKIR